MATSSFVQANCSGCSNLEFRPYVNNCDIEDSDLQALGFVLCGSAVACPTTAANFTTLAGTQKFRTIKHVSGSLADPTPVEVDLSGYSCMPDRLIKEYVWNLNFTTPYKLENHLFWNQIILDSTIASDVFWANKSGTLFSTPSTPTIFVNLSQENGIQIISGTIEWKSSSLPQAYKARNTIWAC